MAGLMAPLGRVKDRLPSPPFCAIGEALMARPRRGIIHRDLKPANILLQKER